MPALVPLHSLLLEGVYSTDHFVKEHAEAPPINPKTMADGLDDFRGKILWRTAKGICLTILGLLDLTETEICQLQVTLMVKKHVFRF